MKNTNMMVLECCKYTCMMVLLLSNTSSRAQGLCGQAYLQTCSASAKMCKTGFQGFQTPTPPLYYLASTEADFLSSGSSGGAFADDSETFSYSTAQTYDPISNSYSYYYDGTATASGLDQGSLTDFWTNSGSVVDHVLDTWSDPGIETLAATINDTDYTWVFEAYGAGLGTVSTSTTGDQTFTNTTDTGNTSNVWFNNSYTTTVSSSYTDDILRGYVIGKIPPYPTNWANGCGAAFWQWADTNHVCASGGRMKYRFHLVNTQLHATYKIKWHEVTTYKTGPPTTTKKSEEVQGNGDPVNGVYSSVHEVDVPTPECVITEVEDSVRVVPPGNAGS